MYLYIYMHAYNIGMRWGVHAAAEIYFLLNKST